MGQFLLGYPRQPTRPALLAGAGSKPMQNGLPNRPGRSYHVGRHSDSELPSGLFTTVRVLIKRQVYRAYILWNGSLYVIIVPCITFFATFSEHRDICYRS